MVSGTRVLSAEAQHSHHAQRAEGMARREGTPPGEHADVEASQDKC